MRPPSRVELIDGLGLLLLFALYAVLPIIAFGL